MVLVPADVPIKSVKPAEVPPFAGGFATVILAAPVDAMSLAEIAACNCVLEMKVVVRDVPLNCTMAAGSKLTPVSVNVNAAPPAIAEPGLSNAMLGVDAVGAGVGAGMGNAAGRRRIVGKWAYERTGEKHKLTCIGIPGKAICSPTDQTLRTAGQERNSDGSCRSKLPQLKDVKSCAIQRKRPRSERNQGP